MPLIKTSTHTSLCSGQGPSHTLSSVQCGILAYSSHSILRAGGGNSGCLSSGVSWLMPHVVMRQPLQNWQRRGRERTRQREDECWFSGAWRALASPSWASLPVPDSLPALLQHNLSSFTEICSPQGPVHSYTQESNTPLILLWCQEVGTKNWLVVRDSGLFGVLAQILRDTVVRWVIPLSRRLKSIYCPVYKSKSRVPKLNVWTFAIRDAQTRACGPKLACHLNVCFIGM